MFFRSLAAVCATLGLLLAFCMLLAKFLSSSEASTLTFEIEYTKFRRAEARAIVEAVTTPGDDFTKAWEPINDMFHKIDRFTRGTSCFAIITLVLYHLPFTHLLGGPVRTYLPVICFGLATFSTIIYLCLATGVPHNAKHIHKALYVLSPDIGDYQRGNYDPAIYAAGFSIIPGLAGVATSFFAGHEADFEEEVKTQQQQQQQKQRQEQQEQQQTSTNDEP